MAASLSLLAPEFRPYARALVEVAQKYGLRPRVSSTYRSLEEQRRLYERYVAGLHPYPVAPPGQSWHNYGLALDLVSTDNTWLGAVWRHWGGFWTPSDAVHFGAYG